MTTKQKNEASLKTAYAAYNEAHDQIRNYSNNQPMMDAYQAQADNAMKVIALLEKILKLN
jgi:hypothetical protein